MTGIPRHDIAKCSQYQCGRPKTLIAPADLRESVPVDDTVFEFVSGARHTINSILDRNDPRLFVVVGPCSIHDVDAAMVYAEKAESDSG